MPVHDWARAPADVFHAFHIAWFTHLGEALNAGILPSEYYSMPEQHIGQTFVPSAAAGRRTLAIRHVSGHRIIAIVEIISPADKDRARHVDHLAGKIASALGLGVHVLLVDLFPPGPSDRAGMHAAVWRQLNPDEEAAELDSAAPLMLAAYAAGPEVKAYVEPIVVGGMLPAMPLFLDPDRYIRTPLEQAYDAAFRGMPEYWRNVLNG